MKINDIVFGEVEVTEPVLLEMIAAPTFQRLKRINQYGIPDKYYHFKNYNRFDHSVGVAVLLKQLGASLEEQVAGLLHDVSVTAFSHIADWVFGQGTAGNEDYHETLHDRFIGQTEIRDIVEQHGFDPEKIMQLEAFPLLERDAPALCADRVEYAFREFSDRVDSGITEKCLPYIVAHENEIVFAAEEPAYEFAKHFVEDLQTGHFGSAQAVKRYYLFSEIMKRALGLGVITEDDFFTTDDLVMVKVEESDDELIQQYLTILSDKQVPEFPNQKQHVVKKFRYVDPPVTIDGKRVLLSEFRPDFKELLEKHTAINKHGFDF